jgi:hypothetical protein
LRAPTHLKVTAMSSYTDVQAKATALGLNLIHLEGLNKFALQKPYHGPGQDWWQ